MVERTKIEFPPMTKEEQERAFAVLAAARKIIEADRAAGRIFPPAGEIIDEIRAEEDEDIDV